MGFFEENLNPTARILVEAVGGRCLPCSVDICDENQIQAVVDKAIEVFGGIDVLINSASAPTDTPTNKYVLETVHFDTQCRHCTTHVCNRNTRSKKRP